MPREEVSTWLMVLARGRIEAFPLRAAALLTVEFLRTLPVAVPELVLSRRPLRGRGDGVVVV